MTKPIPSGLSHMTFIAADLDKMEAVLIQVLGATPIYDSGSHEFSLSPERFYDLSGLWIAVMQGEALPSRTYNHIAFKINEADLAHYQQAVEALGLDMRPPRPRVEGEGQSLYFHDYDNHLFELHTGTLQQRLKRYNQEA